MSSEPSIAAPARRAPPPLSWRVWPLAERAVGAWSVVILAIAASAVVGLAMQSVGWAAAAWLLLHAALWRFFVPAVYEISALGIVEEVLGRRRRIPWNHVDRYRVCRQGVYLTSEGAPLEAFRGMFIPWGRHRQQVLALLEYYLPPARRE